MQERITFALFPYLRTSEPISIGGIIFRSTQDTTDLSPDQAEKLRGALEFFYLQDDIRISVCSYAVVPYVNINHPEEFVPFEKLRHVVAYLYAVPHLPSDGTWLALEHATLFLLSPAKLSEYLVRPYRQGILGNNQQGHHDHVIDGFEGICNLRHYLWLGAGSRIYPPVHAIVLGGRQDLALDFRLSAESHELSILLRALTDEPTDLSQRILAAIRWFNRGCSLDADDEPSLVSLAIAFETLLALPEGEATSERFREAVLTLLGGYPKLDDWLMQFYRARPSLPMYLRHGTGNELG